MRAVLDANVIIAALLSPAGTPAQALARWVGGSFELIVSEKLLAELERALAYPKLSERIDARDAADVLRLLRRTATVAKDPPTLAHRSADPGDDYLLALAASERAHLVSGDRHLLDLAAELPIQSARDFLASLDAADGPGQR